MVQDRARTQAVSVLVGHNQSRLLSLGTVFVSILVRVVQKFRIYHSLMICLARSICSSRAGHIIPPDSHWFDGVR
jgi:hypothetical protein